jgi:hypothetical protein
MTCQQKFQGKDIFLTFGKNQLSAYEHKNRYVRFGGPVDGRRNHLLIHALGNCIVSLHRAIQFDFILIHSIDWCVVLRVWHDQLDG